jgi:hypothetical protein
VYTISIGDILYNMLTVIGIHEGLRQPTVGADTPRTLDPCATGTRRISVIRRLHVR